ncbi:hypothetical protein RV03_GL003071 [Enterococcus gallinarum]|nr:hypothetical protein RV03_GL003071 [Enterococcus gallinarum]
MPGIRIFVLSLLLGFSFSFSVWPLKKGRIHAKAINFAAE